LALLTYNRAKAYNIIAAEKISATLPDIPANFDKEFAGDFMFDFLPDVQRLDEAGNITSAHLVQYSTFELKLNLMFGLKPLYGNFISDHLHLPEFEQQVKQLLWLVQERKGVIFIEWAVLQNSLPAGIPNNLPVNGAVLIFPGFVPSITTPAFANRLQVFCSNNLPVTVPVTVYYAPANIMDILVPAFANWVNSMRYNETGTNDKAASEAPASALLNVLNSLTTTP
ncbi:MAG: hypothetical protein JNM68_01455, partial [Dinghuibacter sp.]|nr:hypothetical protein [Dinghuibacter sp.]